MSQSVSHRPSFSLRWYATAVLMLGLTACTPAVPLPDGLPPEARAVLDTFEIAYDRHGEATTGVQHQLDSLHQMRTVNPTNPAYRFMYESLHEAGMASPTWLLGTPFHPDVR